MNIVKNIEINLQIFWRPQIFLLSAISGNVWKCQIKLTKSLLTKATFFPYLWNKEECFCEQARSIPSTNSQRRGLILDTRPRPRWKIFRLWKVLSFNFERLNPVIPFHCITSTSVLVHLSCIFYGDFLEERDYIGNQGSIWRGWPRVWSLFDLAKIGRLWSLFAKNTPKSWKNEVFRRKMAIFQNFRCIRRKKLVTFWFWSNPPPFRGHPSKSIPIGNKTFDFSEFDEPIKAGW